MRCWRGCAGGGLAVTWDTQACAWNAKSMCGWKCLLSKHCRCLISLPPDRWNSAFFAVWTCKPHFRPCNSGVGICVVLCFRCSPPFGKWGLWGVLRPAASSICSQVHTGSYWSWILMALQCNISPHSTLTCKYRPHSDSTVQLMWHVRHSKKSSHAMFRVILNVSCCYVSKPSECRAGHRGLEGARARALCVWLLYGKRKSEFGHASRICVIFNAGFSILQTLKANWNWQAGLTLTWGIKHSLNTECLSAACIKCVRSFTSQRRYLLN